MVTAHPSRFLSGPFARFRPAPSVLCALSGWPAGCAIANRIREPHGFGWPAGRRPRACSACSLRALSRRFPCAALLIFAVYKIGGGKVWVIVMRSRWLSFRAFVFSVLSYTCRISSPPSPPTTLNQGAPAAAGRRLPYYYLAFYTLI